MDDRATNLIEKMSKERGIRPSKAILAQKDPEYMELYHNMVMHVFHSKKTLPLKYKEIIAVCMDALTFYESGFRAHVRYAIDAGATEEEILEALEVVTLLGVHPLSAHISALKEEMEQKAAGERSQE